MNFIMYKNVYNILIRYNDFLNHFLYLIHVLIHLQDYAFYIILTHYTYSKLLSTSLALTLSGLHLLLL